jgi:plastocyanin
VIASRLLTIVALAVLVACSGPAAAQPKPGPTKPTPTRPVPGPTAGDPPRTGGKLGPVRERAAALREGAALLEKAQDTLDDGNKNLAEQLFSTAELLIGADAIASLADVFRAGAPPRITTPLTKLVDEGPQQKGAIGSSDDDEADPPERGSLEGELKIAGKAPAGTLAFVTLEPIGRRGKTRKPKQRVMEQRDRQFAPRLMLVPVGSTVTFPNFDKIFHNVFSTSDVQPFDLGLYKQGDSREVTFTKEGIIRIGCNLHANMSASIVVIKAPHYVFTDPSGKFVFKSLQPGKYTLRAWSEKSAAPITKEVKIESGKNKIGIGVEADGPEMTDKFGASRGAKK